MIYTFVIDATADDLAAVREGSARLAALAATHDMPLTWIVDVRSARSLGEWFGERHAAGGVGAQDEFVLWLDTHTWISDTEGADATRAAAERLVTQRAELPGKITTQMTRAKEALPWADVRVVGADMKNSALIASLEELEIQGLWGYRWNEASPRAQDRGCPFGFFYAGSERHQSAGPPISKVVGVPRHSGDLRHWRRVPPEPPEVAPDEHAVLPSEESAPPPPTRQVDETDVETTRLVINQTCAIRDVNEWSAVVQTVSADTYVELTEPGGAAIGGLWEEIRSSEFTLTTVPGAVDAYARQFPETEPAVVASGPIEDDDVAASPTSREVFYYDARAQYVFDHGLSEPAEFLNYVSASASSKYLTEYEAPTITSFVPTRVREALTLEVAIDAAKPMPYALFLWNDHRHLRLAETNVLEVRWVGKHGILVQLDLEPGSNEFTLDLTI